MGGGAPLREATRRDLVRELAAHRTYLGVLALDDGHAVGLANCFLGFSTFAARPILNVRDLLVHREARRRGVGRLLLAAVERLAEERGCCKLTLEVLSGNAGALATYASFGFQPSTLDPRSGSALCLQKVLAGR